MKFFWGRKALTLFVGEHEVRIYHPGPAHTRGDAVVYFPDEHAIATGRFVSHQFMPRHG